MSDVWQGPGWWLAPDGKWYPEDGGPPESDATTITDSETQPDLDGPGRDVPSSAEPATSGWQAVEPDSMLVDDAPWAGSSEVGAEWTDPAVPAGSVSELTDQGWTSAFDGSEVDTKPPGGASVDPIDTHTSVDEVTLAPADLPEPPIATNDITIETAAAVVAGAAAADADTALERADVGTDTATAPDDSAPSSTAKANAGDPIERDDAWRKPTDGGSATNGVTTPTGVAEFVDLGAPPTADAPVAEDSGVPWGSIMKALGVVLALVAIALLLNMFFNDDDGELTTEPGPDATSSAPTSDASSTTESSAPESSTDAPSSSDESTSTSVGDTTDGTEVSVFNLRQGDCIESEIGSGQVQKLIAVDCAKPHEFEVYREALIDNTITTYDVDAISAQAEEVCRTSLAAYIPEDDDRDLKFKWFQPTEESWNQEDNPDRVITCLLFDEDGKLTGRAA